MSADFRETLYTIDKKGRRKWVYSHLVVGKFLRVRTVVAYLLMAFYLSMPWITIGGLQGILLDIPGRKFIFFGTTFWATDSFFLVLILGFLAFTLFFVTAMFGRVWCGWACPETVFLEFLFRPIERLIEGSPAQRLKLDQQPWNLEKIWKKGLKHLACAACAWVIASTTLAYFIGHEPLLRMMSDWPTHNLGPFVMTFVLMGAMAFQFGWFREQFCTIMCPYARFQSVMMDSNSIVVGYDPNRGEPRGKRKKGAVEDPPLGDCIDCGLCVRVCPTGIDIRNGLQLECVACTACIDACDSIMTQIGKPPGLIRYDTENKLKGKPSRFIRPRLIVYACILVVYLAGFSYTLSTREDTDFKVLRANKDVPFSSTSDGKVLNHFNVRIANKSGTQHQYVLEGIEPPALELVTPLKEIVVQSGQLLDLPVFVKFPAQLLKQGKASSALVLRGPNGTLLRQDFILVGPE